MRSETSSTSQRKRKFPLSTLAWMLVVSLLFGVLQLGYPLEIFSRNLRNSLRSHPASGQIVFVAIDDKSLAEVTAWPWPRKLQGELITKVDGLGAKAIFHDIVPLGPDTEDNDQAFAGALRHSGKVWLPSRLSIDSRTGTRAPILPYAPFLKVARVAYIAADYDYLGAVWSLPRQATVGGVTMPGFAAAMSSRQDAGDPFRVDYSIDARTVPTFSAADVLGGRVPAGTFAGKTVIIGAAADKIGDLYFIPGRGRLPGPFVQIIGAETLRQGAPRDLGWLPGWLAAALMVVCALASRKRFVPATLMLGAGLALATASVALDGLQMSIDILPGLFILLECGGYLGWRRFRERGLINMHSGLPNLEALRTSKDNASRPLIAVRIQNYAEVVSTMPRAAESELLEQVIKRLRVGAEHRQIFQGDEGIFGWFAEPGAPVGNHLEALHALFRQPISAGGAAYDVAISFGVELGSGRALANRFGSALVAADEAWSEGLRWKYHDPTRLEEASWRLSLLSQLDAAIDNGEVWVAFQPQIRLDDGETLGAEALARWTHPEKGPISPSEFVAAAEQQDRIAKLTRFVLERSIGVAASINQRGIPFTVAVNLSARMLADRDFPREIEAMLQRHGLPPQRLTLELTETAALDGNGRDLAALDCLRAYGIRLAIDDYGTGLSTLEYLKKVPANELKIDQSFVKAMRFSRSDRLMVQSTISLAHSLGRSVIAEGVEDRATLDMLSELGCDVAQGFVVGRPMATRELIQRLVIERRRRAA